MPSEKQESYWIESSNLASHNTLTENTETEVVIVGGGITGITAAYLLAKEGKDVVLLEADRILHGTTGHTTAKVTAQHGMFYDELISHIGEKSARLYYDVNMHAKEFIENTIQANDLDCGFEQKDAVLYAVSEKSEKKLSKEIKAYETLGIPHEVTSELPFDVSVKRALHMKNQAQFHPLQYLTFLVEEFINLGGRIYEQTVAVDMLEGEKPTVETRDGQYVVCDHVLSCSHYPFYDRENLFFTRMYAERSYVVAAKGESVSGMYLSVDNPKRSIRSVEINGESHLLLGGEGHKAGQGEPTELHYQALKDFGREAFSSSEFPYKWSAQDLYTLDHIPYIGVLTEDYSNTYFACGFRKWGMTSGTAAAMILKDYVLGKQTGEMEMFHPSRILLDPGFKEFFKQNMNVAGHFIGGKLKPTDKLMEDVQIGEGAHVSCDGRKSGAYRDENGVLFIVDATCTHLGCEVEWNGGDRTWDCPCHGSRFNYDGTVREGPAKQPLERLD